MRTGNGNIKVETRGDEIVAHPDLIVGPLTILLHESLTHSFPL